MINTRGEKSNPAMGGTTRRIGLSKGSTNRSRNTRMELYGLIKYERMTSTSTINETTRMKINSVVIRINPIVILNLQFSSVVAAP